METIKKETKESFVSSILLIAFGILLLINPDNFMNMAINVFGYLGIFFGVIYIFRYFRLSKEEKLTSNNLTNGIVLTLYGILAIILSDLLSEVITVVLGSYLIFKNAKRVNIGLNFLEINKKTAPLLIIYSIINLILSFILIKNPFTFNINLNTFIAIILFISEGLNIIGNIIILFNLKKVGD